MVSRFGFFKIVLAGAVGLALAVPVSAGEWQKPRHKNLRHHQMHRSIATHVNAIPGVGVYSGNIAVYHLPGVGTSSYFEGRIPAASLRREVSVKIISVDSDDNSSACSMESGVCVIRP